MSQLRRLHEHHGTETVVVTNDVLRTLDEQKVVYRVLLDLSAAFDTIHHHTKDLCTEFVIAAYK